MSSSRIGLFSWLQGNREYLVERGWAGAVAEQAGGQGLRRKPGLYAELSIHFLTR